MTSSYWEISSPEGKNNSNHKFFGKTICTYQNSKEFPLFNR